MMTVYTCRTMKPEVEKFADGGEAVLRKTHSQAALGNDKGTTDRDDRDDRGATGGRRGWFLFFYFPRKTGARFSLKAETPSA